MASVVKHRQSPATHGGALAMDDAGAKLAAVQLVGDRLQECVAALEAWAWLAVAR
jgi:hypothetical protein